jgi:hypothetical protein
LISRKHFQPLAGLVSGRMVDPTSIVIEMALLVDPGQFDPVNVQSN